MHLGVDASLPELMVRSVRLAMPQERIVQFTDEATPAVEEGGKLPHNWDFFIDTAQLDGAMTALLR